MIGGIIMGLFDKLNEQLDINEYKSRAFNEEELRRAERMIFEGYSLPILEGGNNGWHSYYTWNRKEDSDFNKRISNPWKPIKDPEKESLKKEKEELKNTISDLNKKLSDKEADRLKKDTENKEKAERDQSDYDEEFDYLFKRHIAVYKECFDQIDTIKASGLEDSKKKEQIIAITKDYRKEMDKIKNELNDLHRDYRTVRKHKLLTAVLNLDPNADLKRGYV